MSDNIQNLQKSLSERLPQCSVKIRKHGGVELNSSKENLVGVLAHLREHFGYRHLSHISCVDWLEQNQFELVYILWNYESRIQLFVKVRLARENGSGISIRHLWPQADTYEREIAEMYGLPFDGNENPRELILEDWDAMPPMRRDFDTRAYSKEAFYDRPGREDAKDVRSVISGRSGEEIPEIAIPYTRK